MLPKALHPQPQGVRDLHYIICHAHLRVEVDVVQDDSVRSGQVQALAARARAQQERKHARVGAVESARGDNVGDPWSPPA